MGSADCFLACIRRQLADEPFEETFRQAAEKDRLGPRGDCSPEGITRACRCRSCVRKEWLSN